MGRFFEDFDDFSDDDFDDFGFQCKGTTKAGTRCKLTVDSPYPPARTILDTGYCTAHLKDAKAGGSGSGGSFFATRHDIYERDKPHPAVVQAARRGELTEVRRILDKDPKQLDARRKRREVEEKHGYDKEWTWDDDTALIAAARNGHVEVVQHLLVRGADPLCKSCPEDDVHETALQAVETKLRTTSSATTTFYSTTDARAALQKQKRLETAKKLLQIATQHWPLPKSPPAPPPAPPQPPMSDAARQHRTANRHDIDSLSTLTVADLKPILKQFGQKISGKKAELVARLEAVDGPLAWERARRKKEREKWEREREAEREEKKQAWERDVAAHQARFADEARKMEVSLAERKLKLEAAAVVPAINEAEVVGRVVARPVGGSSSGGGFSFFGGGGVGASSSSAGGARNWGGGAAASSSSGQFGGGFGAPAGKRPAPGGFSANEPPAKRRNGGRPKCQCGRDFVNENALSSHLKDSQSCPFAKRYRR